MIFFVSSFLLFLAIIIFIGKEDDFWELLETILYFVYMKGFWFKVCVVFFCVCCITMWWDWVNLDSWLADLARNLRNKGGDEGVA